MSQTEIEQLRDRIGQLEAAIASMTSRDRAAVAEPEPQADEDGAEVSSSRRGLLKAAAAAAGAAVVATVATVGEANATDGDPLLAGNWTVATSLAEHDYTGSTAGAGFLFQSGTVLLPGGPVMAGYPSALAGATTRGVQPTGVLGYSEANPGTGVWGVAAGPTGVGIRATGPAGLVALAMSANGHGVEGSANAGYGVRGSSTDNVGVVGNSSNHIGIYGAGTTGVRGEGATSGLHGEGLGSGDGVVGNAVGSGVGVEGTSLSGPGVLGRSTSSYGVSGETHSTTHAAVIGVGLSGIGVAGSTDDPAAGTGVVGFGRIGVRAQGGAYSFHAESANVAALLLSATPTGGGTARLAPPARSDVHAVGELDIDVNGELWFCVGAGTPGAWRKLAGPTTAGAFHAVTPGRVYDSRVAAPGPAAVLATSQERTVSVRDRRSTADGSVTLADFVPAGAVAIAANVTVVDTVGAGFLTANPGGVHEINAATINWSASDQILNNGVILTLDTNRELNVIAGGGTGAATHVVIDVTGYYR